MENPMILRTIDKVDQAVARLQELQTSISTTRMNLETNGSSEPQKSCRRSRSPRIDCHNFLGGYKKLAQCTEIFLMKEEEVPIVSKAKWRQWSAPAEVVHQAISEIIVASRFAKEMGALLTDSVEQLRYHDEHQEKLRDDPEKHVLRKFKVALPTQGPAGQKQVCDDIIYSAKDECAQACTRGPNSFENSMAPASSLVNGSHSSLLKETLKMSMEATKIKTAQKLWKISLPTKAVIFPNQSFAPNSSPPSSPTLLKTSTALKHVDALSSSNKKKYSSPKQSTSIVNSQRRPSSAGKSQGSPVKSVSTKVEVKLPTRSKTGATCQKLTSTSSGSGIAKEPHNCEELPIYYVNYGVKKPIKVPSSNSHVDTRDHFRKSHGHGLSGLQYVNQQRSSIRLSKMKNADMFDGQRCFQKKVVDGKPKVSELVNDKENLQLAGCTPAALCLKRNWL